MELALFATFYKDMAFSFVNNSSLDCTLLSFSFLIDSYSYHNTKIPKKRLFHLTNFNFPFSNNYPLSSLFPFLITWGHCNQPSQPSFTHHIISILFSVFRKWANGIDTEEVFHPMNILSKCVGVNSSQM